MYIKLLKEHRIILIYFYVMLSLRRQIFRKASPDELTKIQVNKTTIDRYYEINKIKDDILWN